LSWIGGLAAAPSGQTEPNRATDSKALAVVFRWYPLLLGIVSMLYAGSWLIYLRAFKADPAAESRFCQIGVCDTNGTVETLTKAAEANSRSVPPPDMVEFLRREPAAPHRWSAVAESLWKAGRIEQARKCFLRAVSLAPTTAGILLEYAAFQFALGERWQ